jgi:hypothetical protein
VKKVDQDRDLAIERLLGSTTSFAAPRVPEACPDADTLAAWCDDALAPRERTAVETHAAGCERCQAWLAAMVRTAPAPAPTRWWRSHSLAWLAPLAATAAAVGVWAIVPRVPGRQQPLASRPISPATVSSAAADGPRQMTGATTGLAAVQPNTATPREARVSPAREAPASRAALLDRAAQASRSQEEAAARTPAAAPTAEKAVAAGLAAAPASAAADQAASQAISVPAPSPPVAALPEVLRGRTTAESAPAAPARFLSRVASSRPPIVVASNGRSQWRVSPGGVVEHSVDAGASWQIQESGVNVTLAAGAAPNPSVCWLVGPGGVVLLSTDGRSWQQIAFPETTDLVSIQATDDKSAVVVAANGRTFITKDGGRNWSRSP